MNIGNNDQFQKFKKVQIDQDHYTSQYSFIQRGNFNMKQYLNEKEDQQISANPENNNKQDLLEPIKTSSLLALCLELTIKPQNQINPLKQNEDISENNYKEMYGLVQLLLWRINSINDLTKNAHQSNQNQSIQITQMEFDKLYEEWMSRKGFIIRNKSTMNILKVQSMLKQQRQKELNSMCLNDIKTQLIEIFDKLLINSEKQVRQMQEILNISFNRQLNQIAIVNSKWIHLSDLIFEKLTEWDKSQNCSLIINPITAQNLLLSLLLNEINDSNIDQMPTLVRKQSMQLLDHLCHQEGVVVRRFFKQYLIQQGLTSPNDLVELNENVNIVTDLYQIYLNDFVKNYNSIGSNQCDIMQVIIDSMNFGQIQDYKFDSIDVFQGIYYLIDQGLLQKKQSNSQYVSSYIVGTYIEKDGEGTLNEISQKLGQYIYVLNSQRYEQFSRIGQAKAIMDFYSEIMKALLIKFDNEMNLQLKIICEGILSQKGNHSSSTIIPHSTNSTYEHQNEANQSFSIHTHHSEIIRKINSPFNNPVAKNQQKFQDGNQLRDFPNHKIYDQQNQLGLRKNTMSDSVILDQNISQATPSNRKFPINQSNDFRDDQMSSNTLISVQNNSFPIQNYQNKVPIIQNRHVNSIPITIQDQLNKQKMYNNNMNNQFFLNNNKNLQIIQNFKIQNEMNIQDEVVINQSNHQNTRSVSAFGNDQKERWVTPRQQFSMKKNNLRVAGSVNQLPYSVNLSVNQSFSQIGVASQYSARQDQSPIRMRNVQDFSQVLNRLNSKKPSKGQNTNKFIIQIKQSQNGQNVKNFNDKNAQYFQKLNQNKIADQFQQNQQKNGLNQRNDIKNQQFGKINRSIEIKAQDRKNNNSLISKMNVMISERKNEQNQNNENYNSNDEIKIQNSRSQNRNGSQLISQEQNKFYNIQQNQNNLNINKSQNLFQQNRFEEIQKLDSNSQKNYHINGSSTSRHQIQNQNIFHNNNITYNGLQKNSLNQANMNQYSEQSQNAQYEKQSLRSGESYKNINEMKVGRGSNHGKADKNGNGSHIQQMFTKRESQGKQDWNSSSGNGLYYNYSNITNPQSFQSKQNLQSQSSVSSYLRISTPQKQQNIHLQKIIQLNQNINNFQNIKDSNISNIYNPSNVNYNI